jgi:predicted enzyme related to lactoylglutathione lyase
MHRSRLCHFVIDVADPDQGVAFWSAALNATEEPLPGHSRPIYRQLRLPDSEIRILLQKTSDQKNSKERMHLDLEADDIEAEVRRLEALGATRWDHQAERGFEFWVLRDPWGNEFCVLQPEFPDLPGPARPVEPRTSGRRIRAVISKAPLASFQDKPRVSSCDHRPVPARASR